MILCSCGEGKEEKVLLIEAFHASGFEKDGQWTCPSVGALVLNA